MRGNFMDRCSDLRSAVRRMAFIRIGIRAVMLFEKLKNERVGPDQNRNYHGGHNGRNKHTHGACIVCDGKNQCGNIKCD